MKKLAELSTLEGIKVLGRLTTEFNKLATDVKFKETCQKYAESHKNLTPMEQFGFIADILLNEYPQTIITILACVQNKPNSEIEKQPILETYNQINELRQDKGIINFFTSFIKKGQKTS